jgi:hypothetical protein
MQQANPFLCVMSAILVQATMRRNKKPQFLRQNSNSLTGVYSRQPYATVDYVPKSRTKNLVLEGSSYWSKYIPTYATVAKFPNVGACKLSLNNC